MAASSSPSSSPPSPSTAPALAPAPSSSPAPAKAKRTGNAVKFAIGGLSGMGATLVVQPLDLVKTRMQLQTARTGTVAVLTAIARNEGLLAIYSGYGRERASEGGAETGREGASER